MRYWMVLLLIGGCDRELTADERRAIDERERVRTAEVRAQQAQVEAERAAIADFKAGAEEIERDAAAWRAKKRTASDYRDDRKRFAARLESYLESVSQVDATVHSSGRTYRVSWPLCDASTIDEIAVDKDMTIAVQVLKVNRLECSDGYTTWTKTWR
jgi:hypothetical protein